VTRETVEQWKLVKRISNSVEDNGYAYLDEHLGVEMIEFHVDDYDFLHLIAKDIGFGIYRGNLSLVRMRASSASSY
jgi:hypothetical protein